MQFTNSNRISQEHSGNVIKISMRDSKHKASFNQVGKRSHESTIPSINNEHNALKSKRIEIKDKTVSPKRSHHSKHRHRSHDNRIAHRSNNETIRANAESVERRYLSSSIKVDGSKTETSKLMAPNPSQSTKSPFVAHDQFFIKTSTNPHSTSSCEEGHRDLEGTREETKKTPRFLRKLTWSGRVLGIFFSSISMVLVAALVAGLVMNFALSHSSIAGSTSTSSTITASSGTTVTSSTLSTSTSSETTTATSTSSTTTSTALAITWNSTATTIAGSATGVAGTTNSQLYLPRGMALDASNSLYVAEYANNRIQKWVTGATNGITVAGLSNGTAGASAAALTMPVAVVVDSSNNMYFTDRGNHRAMHWVIGSSSGTTIAGTTGVAGSGTNQFNTPSAIILYESTNTLYIADTFNHRIVRWLLGASNGTVVAGGNGVGNGNTQLNLPFGCTFDSSTNSFIIANYGSHTIVRWVLGATQWTLIAGVVGTAGSSSTMLNGPLGVVLDSMKNMFVADSNNHRIQFFYAGQSNGTTIAGITGSSGLGKTQLNLPYWALIDGQYNLYVTDGANHRVQKFYYG